jgi:hypothetical protein
MATNVIFTRGNTATINATAITDGQILYNTTAGTQYLDNGTTRIQVGQNITVDTTLNSLSNNPIANRGVAGVMMSSLSEISTVTQAGSLPDALAVKELNSNLGGTTFSVDANGAYVHYTPTGGADPVVKKLGSISGIQTTAFSATPPTDAIAIMIYVNIKDQSDTFYTINTPVFCNRGEQKSQEITSTNTHTIYQVTVTWNATTNIASFTVNTSTLSTANFVAVWLSPSI